MLHSYDRVRLMTGVFESSGAALSDVGYRVEVYDDGGYEVEFSDADGITKAQTVAYEKDLQLAEGIDEIPQNRLPED